jgi:hypothetical protein
LETLTRFQAVGIVAQQAIDVLDSAQGHGRR